MFANNIMIGQIYTIICLKSVAVRKLQVAILARSPREMSQTDRIVWKHILSRVRVSVRPRIFLYAKKTQTIVARMLFTSIRYAARYTTKLEAAEPSQLVGVAARRLVINFDVGGCGVQVYYEFKPRAGNDVFFTFIVCD